MIARRTGTEEAASSGHFMSPPPVSPPKKIFPSGVSITKLDQSARLRSAPQPLPQRSEEHTSELQSLMRISYAVFCLKNKNTTHQLHSHTQTRTTTKNKPHTKHTHTPP